MNCLKDKDIPKPEDNKILLLVGYYYRGVRHPYHETFHGYEGCWVCSRPDLSGDISEPYKMFLYDYIEDCDKENVFWQIIDEPITQKELVD